MSNEEKKLTVKFLLDKVKKKVVFAEADKDFVDILFSFLTLPLGTIIRLIGKQSALGSLCNLYESIENLDAMHLQTEACKTMLLHPQSAAVLRCEDLKVKVDDTRPRDVFHCSNPDCCSKSICFGSSVANARCPHCRLLMDNFKVWTKRDKDSVSSEDGDGVFIKGGVTFMISDDLHVNPTSVAYSISLLRKLGIADGAVLEEIAKDFGTKEIINLLKTCLVSKAPLTAFCFNKMETVVYARAQIDTTKLVQVKDEVQVKDADVSIGHMKVKLFVANGKVLCAEAGEDFVDVVLSFLAFPLGAVIKLLNASFSLGCIDNLYQSVQGLSLDYIKSSNCRDMLLTPKLASFFGCDNQLLKMNELPPRENSTNGRCFTCFWGEENVARKCNHGVSNADFILLNPKSPDGKTEEGGRYAKGPGRFMVTDDLHFYPLTPISMTKFISSQGSHISEIVEKAASVKHVDVLGLLRAVLISPTPLSDVFLADYKRKEEHSLA